MGRVTLRSQWRIRNELVSSTRLNLWKNKQLLISVGTYKINTVYYASNTRMPFPLRTLKHSTWPSKHGGCHLAPVQVKD